VIIGISQRRVRYEIEREGTGGQGSSSQVVGGARLCLRCSAGDFRESARGNVKVFLYVKDVRELLRILADSDMSDYDGIELDLGVRSVSIMGLDDKAFVKPEYDDA
jgi:hypothetical protein